MDHGVVRKGADRRVAVEFACCGGRPVGDGRQTHAHARVEVSVAQVEGAFGVQEAVNECVSSLARGVEIGQVGDLPDEVRHPHDLGASFHISGRHPLPKLETLPRGGGVVPTAAESMLDVGDKFCRLVRSESGVMGCTSIFDAGL